MYVALRVGSWEIVVALFKSPALRFDCIETKAEWNGFKRKAKKTFVVNLP